MSEKSRSRTESKVSRGTLDNKRHGSVESTPAPRRKRLDHYRRLLHKLLAPERTNGATEDTPPERKADELETITERQGKEMSDKSETRKADVRSQILWALERMRDGTYGICCYCEDKIHPDRLEVIPYAVYCTKCQTREEIHDKLVNPADSVVFDDE